MNRISSTHSPVHYVKRTSTFNDLIDVYRRSSIITEQYPLQMSFVNEMAVDLGGVSRDVVTGFWLHAYEKLFDGSTVYVPVVNPSTDLSQLEVVGKILSHGYLSIGFLPVPLAFPTLIAMLLGPSVEIDSHILNASFFEYLGYVDRDILCRAVQIAKVGSYGKFPLPLEQELLTVFSMFGIRQVPTPSSILATIADMSKYLFLTNPMSAICAVNAVIPVNHRPFWNSKSPVNLQHLYYALTATPAKVLSLIDEPFFVNAAEECSFGYLRQFIDDM